MTLDQVRFSLAMLEVSGFSPVARVDATVLILGSMPGVRSLEKQQYYAQLRNVFWTIMGRLFKAGVDLPYEERLNVLKRNGIALWDVLRNCERPGSLDSSINESTAEPNDFEIFFGQHDQIHQIFFNGLTASKIYLRKVQPNLGPQFASIPYVVLPSTSPAHASMTLDGKAEKWSTIGDHLQDWR